MPNPHHPPQDETDQQGLTTTGLFSMPTDLSHTSQADLSSIVVSIHTLEHLEFFPSKIPPSARAWGISSIKKILVNVGIV